MLHKILISILSFFCIGNIVTMLFGFDIVRDMYSSYGLTDQLPNSFVYLYNCRVLLWFLLFFVIIITLCYDLYFSKRRRVEKIELYKKVSKIAYIIIGAILLTTLLLFVYCMFRPLMDVYMASFLFEANGI